MTGDYRAPLRLRLDTAALVHNWNWLRDTGGAAACGAAVKADGYGLGAAGVVKALSGAGCRDFFVATWGEALEILPLLDDGVSLSVLHGVRDEDMAMVRQCAGRVRPVLNSAGQIRRWKDAGGGTCDVMIDTGMNRLGLSLDGLDKSLLEGLEIDTLMSHLACADEDHHLNGIQLMLFGEARKMFPARRASIANSAGICLGPDYGLDLTRPGLALYGGIARGECEGNIQPVVTPQAQILQRRRIAGGDSIGYGATYVADRTMESATLHLGYADGYGRVFSDMGNARVGDVQLPVLGRVSMDLISVDVSAMPELEEGDWVDIDFDLSFASMLTGMSQYELLTGLGKRLERSWL
ncbi:alanine racemase [Sphingobium subterraneum]|uniref:alanine racemase n=1 Tax=Sphingobium subterraneum TaxID=627688 RepID=A0A841J4U5_9SPHN|nr:alanine racemase [Sphingobium subterraneum]MBB6123261.1 alanine racemase [Sphingobium subterraneum]